MQFSHNACHIFNFALSGWAIHKFGVKSSFLQTGQSQRDVFVILLRELHDRGKLLCLLLTASYELLNANSKLQHQSDVLITDSGFTNAPFLHQLFLLGHDDRFVAIASKTVDAILICVVALLFHWITDAIDSRFKLSTIVHGPRPHRYFYKLSVIQHDYLSIQLDIHDKLAAIMSMPTSRYSQRDVDSPIRHVESRSFPSVYG